VATINAALALGDLLAREGLHAVLERSLGIGVVEAGPDERSVLKTKPDVVFVDAAASSSGRVGAAELVGEIDRRRWTTAVILVTRHPDLDDVLALFEAGLAGRGYLLEERLQSPGELFGAIETVVAGGWVLDPWVASVLSERRRLEDSSALARLTPRESDVIAEIADGKSNAAIARSLSISKRGVEHHIASILSKLDLGSDDEVSRRVAATLLYLRCGAASTRAWRLQDDALALQAEAQQQLSRGARRRAAEQRSG